MASAASDDELCAVFRFEEDFAAALPCLPMSVRFKLDACGVKLSLKEWNRLTTEDRKALLSHRISSPQALADLAGAVEEMVTRVTGAPPGRFPVDVAPGWSALAPPAEVVARAAEEGFTIGDERWRALSDLQRFALCKLSRPRHKNENFASAAREFGLVSQ